MMRKWRWGGGGVRNRLRKVEQRKLYGTMSQEEFCWTNSTSRGGDCLRSDVRRLCSSGLSLIRTKGSFGSQGSMSIDTDWRRTKHMLRSWPKQAKVENAAELREINLLRAALRVCSWERRGYTEYIKSSWHSREGNAAIEIAEIHKSEKSQSWGTALLRSRLRDPGGNRRMRRLRGRGIKMPELHMPWLGVRTGNCFCVKLSKKEGDISQAKEPLVMSGLRERCRLRRTGQVFAPASIILSNVREKQKSCWHPN